MAFRDNGKITSPPFRNSWVSPSHQFGTQLVQMHPNGASWGQLRVSSQPVLTGQGTEYNNTNNNHSIRPRESLSDLATLLSASRSNSAKNDMHLTRQTEVAHHRQQYHLQQPFPAGPLVLQAPLYRTETPAALYHNGAPRALHRYNAQVAHHTNGTPVALGQNGRPRTLHRDDSPIVLTPRVFAPPTLLGGYPPSHFVQHHSNSGNQVTFLCPPNFSSTLQKPFLVQSVLNHTITHSAPGSSLSSSNQVTTTHSAQEMLQLSDRLPASHMIGSHQAVADGLVVKQAEDTGKDPVTAKESSSSNASSTLTAIQTTAAVSSESPTLDTIQSQPTSTNLLPGIPTTQSPNGERGYSQHGPGIAVSNPLSVPKPTAAAEAAAAEMVRFYRPDTGPAHHIPFAANHSSLDSAGYVLVNTVAQQPPAPYYVQAGHNGHYYAVDPFSGALMTNRYQNVMLQEQQSMSLGSFGISDSNKCAQQLQNHHHSVQNTHPGSSGEPVLRDHGKHNRHYHHRGGDGGCSSEPVSQPDCTATRGSSSPTCVGSHSGSGVPKCAPLQGLPPRSGREGRHHRRGNHSRKRAKNLTTFTQSCAVDVVWPVLPECSTASSVDKKAESIPTSEETHCTRFHREGHSLEEKNVGIVRTGQTPKVSRDVLSLSQLDCSSLVHIVTVDVDEDESPGGLGSDLQSPSVAPGGQSAGILDVQRWSLPLQNKSPLPHPAYWNGTLNNTAPRPRIVDPNCTTVVNWSTGLSSSTRDDDDHNPVAMESEVRVGQNSDSVAQTLRSTDTVMAVASSAQSMETTDRNLSRVTTPLTSAVANAVTCGSSSLFKANSCGPVVPNKVNGGTFCSPSNETKDNAAASQSDMVCTSEFQLISNNPHHESEGNSNPEDSSPLKVQNNIRNISSDCSIPPPPPLIPISVVLKNPAILRGWGSQQACPRKRCRFSEAVQYNDPSCTKSWPRAGKRSSCLPLEKKSVCEELVSVSDPGTVVASNAGSAKIRGRHQPSSDRELVPRSPRSLRLHPHQLDCTSNSLQSVQTSKIRLVKCMVVIVKGEGIPTAKMKAFLTGSRHVPTDRSDRPPGWGSKGTVDPLEVGTSHSLRHDDSLPIKARWRRSNRVRQQSVR